MKTQLNVIILQLCRRDQNTGDLTDESYDLVYHNMDGGPNFLILKQHYDLAVAINWKPQDRFRSLISVNGAELWREGKVIAKHNSSLYLSHVIRFAFKFFIGNVAGGLQFIFLLIYYNLL